VSFGRRPTVGIRLRVRSARSAIFAFRDFDALRAEIVPSVRTYTIVDPVFGAVVFAAVLLTTDVVEIVDFIADGDYWTSLEDGV
jgi:hypothetical protein